MVTMQKGQSGINARSWSGLRSVSCVSMLAILAVVPFSHISYAMDANELPSGGTVVGGDASLDYSTDNELHVYQQSDRTVINWSDFNIGSNALTEFHQNSHYSIAVNRVIGAGADPTQILGRLRSNGTVMVLDNNGVIFGRNASIDVGGIVASTGDIDRNSFMNGGDFLRLTNSNGLGYILNEGTISAANAGLIALVAPTVMNRGIISAKMGSIALSSGDSITLDLYGDGLLEVAVNNNLQKMLIDNSGAIQAHGGKVQISAGEAKGLVDSLVNMSGIIDVSSVNVEGGQIILSGADEITVSGTLDASGHTGGGKVLVGGDYQGGGDITHAMNTTLTSDGIIKANATSTGDGGKIILWSDNQTRIGGTIEANGGDVSGNGGMIETSSKLKLNVQHGSNISASAKNGKSGSWLLDPRNVILRDAAGTDASAGGIIGASNDDEVVDVNTIEAALNGGLNVTITTGATGTQDGDITIDDSIQKTAGGDAILELKAANSILVDGVTISSTNAKLGLILNADADNNDVGAIYLANSTITTNGGDFIAGGGLTPLADAAYGTATHNNGVMVSNTDITTGTGNINLRGHGQTVNSDYRRGVLLSVGSTINTTTGHISINGSAGLGDDHNYGVQIHGVGTQLTSVEGNIDITGTGGSNTGSSSLSNYGIAIQAGAGIVSSGTGVNAATITFDGMGGLGEDANSGVFLTGAGTVVTSVDGAIDITGQGGSNGTSGSNYNYGVAVTDGAEIGSTGVSVNAATITINGTGGNGEDANRGVYFASANSLITSVMGAIDITATAGANGSSGSNWNRGFLLYDAAKITSTGTGANAATITIDGTGGNGEDSNRGVNISSSGTLISSIDGAINITGKGGSNGTSGSNYNYGIIVEDGADITSSGTGVSAATITLNGTGGNGEDVNNGTIVTGAGSTITSAYGDIDLTGTGARANIGSTNAIVGISLDLGASISSTGTGSNAARITLNGTGGEGYHSNYGVALSNANTSINTIDGDVNITALSQSQLSSSTEKNYGFLLRSGAKITSTGTGANAAQLTIHGTGSTRSRHRNRGVYLTDAGSAISSVDGDIDITGIGSGLWNGTSNDGIFMIFSSEILTTGNADISMTGVNTSNGAGTDVLINISGKSIGGASATGDITFVTDEISMLNANVQTSGNVLFKTKTANETIGISGGAGTLQVTDAVISNIDADGALIIGDTASTGAIISDDLDVSSTGYGLELYGGNITVMNGLDADTSLKLSSSGSLALDSAVTSNGDISLISDDLSLISLQTPTDVILKTHTTNASIGLGSGAGTLQVSNAMMNNINAGGALLVGDLLSTGDIHIDNVGISASGYNLSAHGGDITVDTGLDADTSLKLLAQNDITLNGVISANGGGNSVVLAADRFINNAGAAAIDPGAGRFLVYSSDPETDNRGGSTYNFKRYNKTYAGYAPAAVTELGNGYLYSRAPVLLLTAQDVSRVYGDNAPSFSAITSSGLIDGDLAAGAYSGSASLTSIGVNVGTSNITSALGSLSSDMGYQFSFAPGILTIEKAPLVATAEDVARDFGQQNPVFTSSVTGFKMGDTLIDLDTPPDISTTAVSSSPGGVYAITPYGASDANYSFTYVDGALTVTNEVTTPPEIPASVMSVSAVPPRQSPPGMSIERPEPIVPADSETANNEDVGSTTANDSKPISDTDTDDDSSEDESSDKSKTTKSSAVSIGNYGIDCLVSLVGNGCIIR